MMAIFKLTEMKMAILLQDISGLMVLKIKTILDGLKKKVNDIGLKMVNN